MIQTLLRGQRMTINPQDTEHFVIVSYDEIGGIVTGTGADDLERMEELLKIVEGAQGE